MSELAWLAVLAAIVWLWMDSLRAREHAMGTCRRSCQAHGLQLLDETVALEGLALKRRRDGRVQIQRRYRFEFTRDGSERDTGAIVMLGDRVESLDLPHEGGRIIEHSEF